MKGGIVKLGRFCVFFGVFLGKVFVWSGVRGSVVSPRLIEVDGGAVESSHPGCQRRARIPRARAQVLLSEGAHWPIMRCSHCRVQIRARAGSAPHS
jgi:hypothetical protein